MTTYTAVFATENRHGRSARYRLDKLAEDGDYVAISRGIGCCHKLADKENAIARAKARTLLAVLHSFDPTSPPPTEEEIEEAIDEMDAHVGVEIVTGLTLVEDLPQGMAEEDERIIWESDTTGYLGDYRYALALGKDAGSRKGGT
ncbi:MAG TPA: hypothetical protein VHA35_18200 [Dongiaceae bacterium]|nr:hypothetical protein [Dongiaceae bacterium]